MNYNKQQKNKTVINRTVSSWDEAVIIQRGIREQQLLCVRTEWLDITVPALKELSLSPLYQSKLGWGGVTDRAFSWPCSRIMDSSPGEVHKELTHSVFQWWSPPHTGHGCFPLRGSDGSEELSDLKATWVVRLNVDSKQWNMSEILFVHKSENWPSLNSRLSSWFGQRFTTSVTCSAFL